MLDHDMELAVLARFGEVDVPAKDALRSQLKAAVISEEWIADDRGRGALDLEFSREVAPLSSLHGFPIHGWYTDGDGEVVLLILVAGTTNELSHLEFWKPTFGSPIVDWPPDPESICVQAAPSGASQYDFDPATGWTPHRDQ